MVWMDVVAPVQQKRVLLLHEDLRKIKVLARCV